MTDQFMQGDKFFVTWTVLGIHHHHPLAGVLMLNVRAMPEEMTVPMHAQGSHVPYRFRTLSQVMLEGMRIMDGGESACRLMGC
jgi:hypothetical protein